MRVLTDPNAAPLIDMKTLCKPTPVVVRGCFVNGCVHCSFICWCVDQVRVYVLKAFGLTPQDANGLADPYLIVSLGKDKRGDASSCIKETLSPKFLSVFEFTTSLPGESILSVSVRCRVPRV